MDENGSSAKLELPLHLSNQHLPTVRSNRFGECAGELTLTLRCCVLIIQAKILHAGVASVALVRHPRIV